MIRRGWRALVIVATLPWVYGVGIASCASHALPGPPAMTARAERHLRWTRDHLAARWDGYGPLDDMGVPAFDAILLSHLAIGLANVAALDPERRAELGPLIAEVARRALSAHVSPMHRPLRASTAIGDHNLYASHALLILGIAHRLGIDDHDAIATELAEHLRRRSLASGDFHARSYPGSPRWPADQAVTLAALDLHDREHGTDLARAPIAGWLRWIARHRSETGLPWSATGGVGYAAIPRGCALSWTAAFMAQFAPEEGARLYASYRAAHGIDWHGWRGFREWPRDHDGGSDLDAGPVLFGWGTAATGLGLGPARLYGDGAQVAGIERIADTVGMPVPGSARYLLAPTLGQAILFAGETATFWHERPRRLARTTESDAPVAPLSLLLALLALDGWLLRGVLRAGRVPRGG